MTKPLAGVVWGTRIGRGFGLGIGFGSHLRNSMGGAN
jgi:hypothetical protein